MKLYEEKNDSYRSKPRCGYCRKEGHNQYNCPEVAKDWASWKEYKVPTSHHGWYMSRNHPKYWGEWYEKCKEVYYEQQRRANAPKNQPSRTTPKCGFCGEEGHNRRNCDEMQKFIEKCKVANENYRRRVRKFLVDELGLDVGAAIEVSKTASWASMDKEYQVGIITDINWDSVNVFCAFDKGYDATQKYKQELWVQALVDGNKITVKCREFLDTVTANLNDFSIIKHDEGRWSSWKLEKIIGKSEVPLSSDWDTSYGEAWEHLTKKRSYEQLRLDGVVSFIDEWANLHPNNLNPR